MMISKKVLLILLVFSIQACTSIKAPYSVYLHSTPLIIKTSVGNVEVLHIGNGFAKQGMAYLVPGFPGSSLENVPLGNALARKGYSVYLLNPPGHGQATIGNSHWQFHFPQYAQALDESLQTLQAGHKTGGGKIIIAHSAGAEMVFQLLLNKANKQKTLPKINKIILINPWLPSISNTPIPWTSDDENLLHFPPLLVKLLGPLSKTGSYQRLFLNPQQHKDYLAAHENLTENLGGWWPFDSRFVRLMKATTRTQKTILEQGSKYQKTRRELAPLNKQLSRTKTQLIIINSARGLDQIIPSAYKQSLRKSLRFKLPDVSIQFPPTINAGHMLQVEQTGQLVKQLF